MNDWLIARRYGTLVFPGHEYTLAILPGCLSSTSSIPEHPRGFSKIVSLLWRAHMLRGAVASAVPTVPLILSDELLINQNFQPLRRAATDLRPVVTERVCWR